MWLVVPHGRGLTFLRKLDVFLPVGGADERTRDALAVDLGTGQEQLALLVVLELRVVLPVVVAGSRGLQAQPVNTDLDGPHFALLAAIPSLDEEHLTLERVEVTRLRHLPEDRELLLAGAVRKAIADDLLLLVGEGAARPDDATPALLNLLRHQLSFTLLRWIWLVAMRWPSSNSTTTLL